MARKRTRQEADEKTEEKKQASESSEKQASEISESVSDVNDKKNQDESQADSQPSEPSAPAESQADTTDPTESTDDTAILTDWQAVYDATSARYYFWSPSTNKTQWTNPYENSATATATGSNEPEYSYAAHFNARTGRFTSDGSGAEKASDFSRAKRQMDFFFDYDKFAEQRAQEIMNPEPKKKLTKAQVERFKQKTKEKKEMKKKMWLIND